MNGSYVHTVWCDDVRQEVGNKSSFMGVYNGSMVVPELPLVLQRLSAFTIFSAERDQAGTQFAVRLERDDGTVLAGIPSTAIPFELDPNPERTRLNLSFIITVNGMQLLEGVRYFQMVVDTDKGPLIGPKLWVEVNPGLSALPLQEMPTIAQQP